MRALLVVALVILAAGFGFLIWRAEAGTAIEEDRRLRVALADFAATARKGGRLADAPAQTQVVLRERLAPLDLVKLDSLGVEYSLRNLELQRAASAGAGLDEAIERIVALDRKAELLRQGKLREALAE